MNTTERRREGTGVSFWRKQTGDRTGSGCDPGINTGNPVYNKRICNAAGLQLYA